MRRQALAISVTRGRPATTSHQWLLSLAASALYSIRNNCNAVGSSDVVLPVSESRKAGDYGDSSISRYNGIRETVLVLVGSTEQTKTGIIHAGRDRWK
jgi:hypothetical protein